MASPDAFHTALARQAAATALTVRRQWRKMTPGDLDRSWAQIVSRLTLLVGAGMLGAAKDGAAYAAAELDAEAVGQMVSAAAFAEAASDGRALDTLLYGAVIRTKIHLAAGRRPPAALEQGRRWLEALARTQVADAGRGATQVGIAVTPGAGWVRHVVPPCCQRCAVLAGKFFRWNTGFDRHPRCQCVHQPRGGEDGTADLAADITPDQIRDLTEAQRQAIDDGADPNQVINSRRGRSRDGMTTTEGTTQRGYASYVDRAVSRARGERAPEIVTRTTGGRNVTRTRPRPTPELIYRLASDRAEAVRLLHRHGYIVGDVDRVARAVA